MLRIKNFVKIGVVIGTTVFVAACDYQGVQEAAKSNTNTGLTPAAVSVPATAPAPATGRFADHPAIAAILDQPLKCDGQLSGQTLSSDGTFVANTIYGPNGGTWVLGDEKNTVRYQVTNGPGSGDGWKVSQVTWEAGASSGQIGLYGCSLPETKTAAK